MMTALQAALLTWAIPHLRHRGPRPLPLTLDLVQHQCYPQNLVNLALLSTRLLQKRQGFSLIGFLKTPYVSMFAALHPLWLLRWRSRCQQGAVYLRHNTGQCSELCTCYALNRPKLCMCCRA